jgi:hypothetical protein
MRRQDMRKTVAVTDQGFADRILVLIDSADTRRNTDGKEKDI